MENIASRHLNVPEMFKGVAGTFFENKHNIYLFPVTIDLHLMSRSFRGDTEQPSNYSAYLP